MFKFHFKLKKMLLCNNHFDGKQNKKKKWRKRNKHQRDLDFADVFAYEYGILKKKHSFRFSLKIIYI